MKLIMGLSATGRGLTCTRAHAHSHTHAHAHSHSHTHTHTHMHTHARTQNQLLDKLVDSKREGVLGPLPVSSNRFLIDIIHLSKSFPDLVANFLQASQQFASRHSRLFSLFGPFSCAVAFTSRFILALFHPMCMCMCMCVCACVCMRVHVCMCVCVCVLVVFVLKTDLFPPACLLRYRRSLGLMRASR